MSKATFKVAFNDTIPVMFGYFPLGAAFGVLFNTLGYHWLYAGATGLFVYAGAAQFMAVGLLMAHADLLEVFISVLILNSRHLFYGISVMDKYQCPLLLRLYLAFGLTDETYSLVTSRGRNMGAGDPYFFYVTALNQFYWVVGCSIGAYLGSKFQLNVPGLDFALVALFVVLTVEQYKSTQSLVPLIVAAMIAILSLIVVPKYMLLTAILVSCIILLIFGKSKQWQFKRII